MNKVSVLGHTISPWGRAGCWNKKMWVSAAILTITNTYGCLNRQSTAPDTREYEAPKTPTAARVNGEPISQALFEREYLQTLARYKRVQSRVTEDLKSRLKSNIIQKLINQELIVQKAKELGVEPPAEQLENLWLDHKKRYGSEEAFATFLEQVGTTAEDLRRAFAHDVLKAAVFDRLREGISVTGAEIRTFYEKNQERFQQREQVRASHILIRVPKSASRKVIRKKRALASRIRRLVTKPSADFAALARQYGQDFTKNQGGDLGYFPKGRMVKAFEEAVWPLAVGQVAKVTKTSFGFHIIKKTGQNSASHKKLSDVSEQIEHGLLSEKQSQRIRSSLATWEQTAEIEILVNTETSSTNQPAVASPIPGLTSPISTSTGHNP
ncbi:MAG: peptidylprolyl isomerase [Myxococcales bacterium]|nr:peptidylprolyl isomerase [Myxococcales bacterium]